MTQIPTITINVAQSLNGYIAGPSGRRVIISDEDDRKRVHRLRSEVDAVVVGVNTIINDDPSLTVDPGYFPSAKDPIRVVLDRNLRIPETARVLNDGKATLIFTSERVRQVHNGKVVRVPPADLAVNKMVETLGRMGIQRILVEGGRDTIRQFVTQTTVSQFLLYIGDVLIETGGLRLFEPPLNLKGVVKSAEMIGRGVLFSIDPIALRRIWI
ncbi:dihydrofolate reductase family protein [Thermoplasmatales archaeon AK]|nr:dihydrofolate reductase family protein [Thermoplasmatales archaeon AK]